MFFGSLSGLEGLFVYGRIRGTYGPESAFVDYKHDIPTG